MITFTNISKRRKILKEEYENNNPTNYNKKTLLKNKHLKDILKTLLNRFYFC